MANYDNDSSSDDDTVYTTTNVTLGYASNESSGDDVSHIGGHPMWLDPKSTPPASFARCKVCNDNMSLLLQLNADLQQHFPTDSRRLQVWGCRTKACTRKLGSVRAFREVKKGRTSRSSQVQTTASTSKEANVDLGNVLFGGNASLQSSNANPFATNTNSPSVAKTNPFTNPSAASAPATSSKQSSQSESENSSLPQTFADKLQIGNLSTAAPASVVTDPWPEVERFPQPYSFFYLDAGAEELDPTPAPAVQSAAEGSGTKYDMDDTSSRADKDTFESDLDKTFQKFSDIVAQNPEQVLRYEFKGQPLLYSGSDGVAARFVVPHGKVGAVKGMPRCEGCGSHRVFEMQLMPYLIYEIEKDEAVDVDNGMEWGAIIIGTCANNCGDEEAITFHEEWAGVQWEERVVRR